MTPEISVQETINIAYYFVFAFAKAKLILSSKLLQRAASATLRCECLQGACGCEKRCVVAKQPFNTFSSIKTSGELD